jgi:UDP-galactopyranose mutase
VLENGVSFSAYSEARTASSPPKDIADIPGPRIGYSGLIGKRLNLDMIADVAAARPEWSITMVGRVDSRECEPALQRLSAMPNVHLLGEKPPHQVPSYVCAFDVGLLPYAINLETRHISPIKMYEYWAAGVPAVGTDIPSVRRNRDAVSIADDAEGFVAAIASALVDFPAAERSQLLERASVNAWSDRVAQISRDIDARLARKTSRNAHGARGLQVSPSWKGS